MSGPGQSSRRQEGGLGERRGGVHGLPISPSAGRGATTGREALVRPQSRHLGRSDRRGRSTVICRDLFGCEPGLIPADPGLLLLVIAMHSASRNRFCRGTCVSFHAAAANS